MGSVADHSWRPGAYMLLPPPLLRAFLLVLRRMDRVLGSGLARGRLGALCECQDNEERGKPSLLVDQFPTSQSGQPAGIVLM
jgi:hypothetical protein